MLPVLLDILERGPLETSLVAVGGSQSLVLKVRVLSADSVGIVCQVKGMMGGWGENQLRPWSAIASLAIPG